MKSTTTIETKEYLRLLEIEKQQQEVLPKLIEEGKIILAQQETFYISQYEKLSCIRYKTVDGIKLSENLANQIISDHNALRREGEDLSRRLNKIQQKYDMIPSWIRKLFI